MSEYQYYDFRAVDRPLTRNEMAALRSISTRAAITTTSFTNHYEWGDLKANPSKLLEKYFDAFVYVANWGTHEFYIRLPQESVDYKLLKAMIPCETVRLRRTARFVIVEFGCESEWDGEDDGTRWMASLMPLRSDLLRSDLRCLYLGWLRSAQDGGLDEDEMAYVTTNQDTLLNTILEVKCSGLSQDSKGNYSVLHPVYKLLRNDKTIANTLNECIEINKSVQFI